MTRHAYLVESHRWLMKACHKCGGDIFYVQDKLDCYWECLQCGHHNQIDDNFAALPKVDSRWRLVKTRK